MVSTDNLFHEVIIVGGGADLWCTEEGNFAGQSGYGYISFEKFINGINALKEGCATLDDLDKRGLPTLKNTIATGAILEAGRRSIDEKRPVDIIEKDGQWSLQ